VTRWIALAALAVMTSPSSDAESKSRRIFLVATDQANVSKACLNNLSGTLRDAVGRAQGGLELVKSRKDADVVVEVEQCRISTVADAHGTVEGGAGRGDTRSTRVAASVSSGVPKSMATVRITAATEESREEFTPGQPLATNEAMSYVAGALVQWVESLP